MHAEFKEWSGNRRLRAFSWVVLCLLVHSASVFGLNFNIPLSSLTNHNTSASAAYNSNNFGANFGPTTWVNQNGMTMAIDATKMDESLNPITPGHVSKSDVHTLIPNRPDLRWFAHATPWFGNASHINIGINSNTTNYIAAMITDMKNRGFNGVIVDWYGNTDGTDGAVQKIKSYLAGIPGNKFTYIIMVDKGIGLTTNNIEAQIRYCQSNYFSDTNYEHEPVSTGNPILMFFGVRSGLGTNGEALMNTMKSDLGGNMVWVEEHTTWISEAWEDETFQWTDEYQTGVNNSDPFNLSGVTSEFSTIRANSKKAFGAMCSQFNGTLTKSVGWSEGKYLPGSNGLCLVMRAQKISSLIPANMTRMQWPTWSDWEEGTQVETGIENNFAVSGQINSSNLLSWTIASGDERTIDHYEIYATLNGGVNAAFIGNVTNGVHQTNLTSVGFPPGSYKLYIDCIGKPCIRDHISPAVSYIPTTAPVVIADIQPLSQTVWQGDTVSFAVTASGAQPLSYLWMLNGQTVSSGTSSNYSFAALPGTNSYQVVITNSQGSVTSSVATVIGAPATFLTGATNYNGMKITFSGYTNGETLQCFPVLVRLSTNIPGFSYSQFASSANGADLRFTAANGRELPFEIEQWNTAGESQVWVQAPSIASTNDYITAYWGNSTDSAMPPSNTNGAVWSTLTGSNDFLLVYHLNRSGFPFTDSTLQYPATSGVAPVLTTGEIGNGCSFNGSSQFLNSGLVNIGKTFTLSAWVNIAAGANSEQTIWANKTGGWNTNGFDFYVNSYQTNDGIIYFDSSDGVGGNVSARTVAHAVSFGQWHLLTGTMDGANGAVRVYVDGVDQTINTGVDTAFQNTNYVRCGSLLTGTPGSTGNLYFNGMMDEPRIEAAVRSPAWVWTSWATVADSAFARFGTIVPASVTLQCQATNGQVMLTWTAGKLQSAPAANGPYTNVTGAISPFVLAPSGGQQFFRVKVQ